jgi:hypothetical protein
VGCKVHVAEFKRGEGEGVLFRATPFDPNQLHKALIKVLRTLPKGEGKGLDREWRKAVIAYMGCKPAHGASIKKLSKSGEGDDSDIDFVSCKEVIDTRNTLVANVREVRRTVQAPTEEGWLHVMKFVRDEIHKCF